MLAKTKKWPIFIVTVFVGIVITWNHITRESNKMRKASDYPEVIEVKMGQSGDDWENQYGKIVISNKKNFGLNFYDIDSANYGKSMTAIVKTKQLTTELPNVMSISATDDRDRKVGINRLYITAEVNRDEFVSHPIAHQYVMDLVRNLRKTGWRYNFYESAPRLKGQAAFDYYKQENIDPDYPLTFEQWMALPRPLTWRFYADHTYLSLQVERDINHLDPAKPGAYFISLTFQPREEIERLEVDEKDRDNWRATWVERYRKYRAERHLAEAKLRAKGIPIDTHYQEPPLPPPPAGQHNPTIPDDLK